MAEEMIKKSENNSLLAYQITINSYFEYNFYKFVLVFHKKMLSLQRKRCNGIQLISLLIESIWVHTSIKAI